MIFFQRYRSKSRSRDRSYTPPHWKKEQGRNKSVDQAKADGKERWMKGDRLQEQSKGKAGRERDGDGRDGRGDQREEQRERVRSGVDRLEERMKEDKLASRFEKGGKESEDESEEEQHKAEKKKEKKHKYNLNPLSM